MDINELKETLRNVKVTPQLCLEIFLLLIIVASGGWLFLLLVTAVNPGEPTKKYEVEVLSQILDSIFTYVCVINSYPRIKMYLTVDKIIKLVDNRDRDMGDEVVGWCTKLDTYCNPFKLNYSFLLPTLPEIDPEIGNPLVNAKNKQVAAADEYHLYIQKTREGLLVLKQVAVLLNLNWIFQIPTTTVMIWYACIIPCTDHCAFDNRPSQVIAVFLPLSFGSAAYAGYILMKRKMAK